MLRHMKKKDLTILDEKNSLERFLMKETIQPNCNYLRMEKGPKPLFYKAITLSYQLRFKMWEFYFLIFTDDCLYLLTQDEEYQYSTTNMIQIQHESIRDFTFQRKYGAYCIAFTHLDEEYYFYLNDSLSTRLLSKMLNTETMDYTRQNLTYLESMGFMGLLKS